MGMSMNVSGAVVDHVSVLSHARSQQKGSTTQRFWIDTILYKHKYSNIKHLRSTQP